MQILFYCSKADTTNHELYEMMKNIDDQIHIKTYRVWNIFREKLLGPRSSDSLTIVLILNKEELLNAVSIRDYIHEFRSILILPDNDDETVSLGHSLRPNFIAYDRGDLQNIVIVLKKMFRLE